MTIQTVAGLKAKFEAGDKPTEQDWIDLIDTLLDINSQWPATLPAADGSALTNLSLPNPLPALDAEALYNLIAGEWVDLAQYNPNYADPTSFVLTGDHTSRFVTDKRIRLTVASAYEYTTPAAAVYDSIADATTVTINNAMSDITLTKVDVSVFSPYSSGGAISAEMVNSIKTSDAENLSKNIASRNKVQNQEPLSQGSSTRSGMSSTIYTGNGTSQSLNTGVDMTTGNFGGLVWIKGRSSATGHVFTDTVRGINQRISSNSTAVEDTISGVTSFDANGFSVGSHADVNTSAATIVSWNFQTTKKVTGTTNRNKAYTCHYNPDTNFSITGFIGDGVDGHEIPHHLSVVPELTIVKDRNNLYNWIIQSSLFKSTEYVLLNSTAALATASVYNTLFSDSVIKLGQSGDYNLSASDIVMYNFASKSGICKIGKYIGTGAAGNYVSTEVDGDDGFKPAWIIGKELSSTGSWFIHDTIRGQSKYINAESSAAEGIAATLIDFDDNGFHLLDNNSNYNTLNSEYIFMAFAETSIDATKAITDYPYATTPNTVSIANNTLISVANGFNANGQVDTQYQFGSGITKAFGAGFENKHLYLYTDKTGVLGTTEVRPLSGITRNDADKYGEVSPSDPSLRTTSKHFDYESDSGVVLASGESGGLNPAYSAFSKDTNDIISSAVQSSVWVVGSTTNSWLQYKHTEPRILKSWRMREATSVIDTPRRFTIEGSKDGLNWTAIDSTYTTSDYVGNGANLWGGLQTTSSNATAYLYYRINITANNGGGTYTQIAELELNTIIASDYYLVEEAKMYDSSNTAIERVYLGEFKTDSVGDIINSSIINYPVAEQELSSVKVHKDLTVHGKANGRQFATAWVNFDGTQNPPLIQDSFNVANVVDLGTGHFKIIFEVPMDTSGYVVTGIQGGNATGLNLDLARVPNPKEFTIYGYNYASGIEESAVFDLIIFGGKKIK